MVGLLDGMIVLQRHKESQFAYAMQAGMVLRAIKATVPYGIAAENAWNAFLGNETQPLIASKMLAFMGKNPLELPPTGRAFSRARWGFLVANFAMKQNVFNGKELI